MMMAGMAATAMKLIPMGPPTSIASCSKIFFFLLHCFLPQNVHPDGLRTNIQYLQCQCEPCLKTERLSMVQLFMGNPSQSYGVSPAIWHRTCQPTQENSPALTPARQAGNQFTYPRGMEGCVDLAVGSILRF